MFIYEKYDTCLRKKEELISEHGLVKLSAWDRRIKVDFFLDQIPFYEEKRGECYLTYRLEGDSNVQTIRWPACVRRKECHYTYQKVIDKAVASIESCYLQLEDDYMIIGKEAKKEIKAEEVGMKQTSEPSICYIRDLKELLQKEGIYRDLYYNSFLLHGFYQYRHVVEKDGYIGVPGIFYEREAIAAKMMGFPYFIEEKNLAAMDTDHVSLAQMEKTNQNFRKPPVEGTFGYYLHAL